MDNFTTETMEILINKWTLNDLFRRHIELAINSLLQADLTAFLDYEKYTRADFNTEYEELNLIIHRDRHGKFSQRTLLAYKGTDDSLETTII